MISVLGSGILADRLSKRDKSAGSKIGILQGLLGIPLMAGCLLFPAKGFYFSMFFLFLKFLLAEGYMAPTITMM
jgi:hypothetical protein